ncbi:MAG: acyl-CoA thioesterase [Myxococcota bacterium]
MVRYLLRTAPVVVRALLGADGRRISRITRRVRLDEIDPNRHMNQAVYAQVLELGRTDWVLRSRSWTRWRAERLLPVVAEQRIVYRRELAPLQRYAIDTRVVSVEGRLMWFEQHILVGDRVHARGESALIFIGPDGVLTPEQLSPHVDDLVESRLVVEDWRARA